jgi:hypothetical protein
MNEIIEATRDLAHIWDLYGHLIAKSISTWPEGIRNWKRRPLPVS